MHVQEAVPYIIAITAIVLIVHIICYWVFLNSPDDVVSSTQIVIPNDEEEGLVIVVEGGGEESLARNNQHGASSSAHNYDDDGGDNTFKQVAPSALEVLKIDTSGVESKITLMNQVYVAGDVEFSSTSTLNGRNLVVDGATLDALENIPAQVSNLEDTVDAMEPILITLGETVDTLPTTVDVQTEITDHLDTLIDMPNGIPSLDASGHLAPSTIPPEAVTSLFHFVGTWNADTNTPTILSGVGDVGDTYVVGVAGTTTIDAENDWGVSDIIMYNGLAWQKLDHSHEIVDRVVSVAGRFGVVTLQASDIVDLALLGLENLTAGEVSQIGNIGPTTISPTQWSNLGGDVYFIDTNGLANITTSEADQIKNINGATISPTQWSDLGSGAYFADTNGVGGVTTGEMNQIKNIDTVTIDNAQWADLGSGAYFADTNGVGGVTTGEMNQVKNIDSVTINNAQWAYVGSADQSVQTTSDVQVNTLNIADTQKFNDITTPVNPLDTEGLLYKKTNGLYWLPDSAGLEVELTRDPTSYELTVVNSSTYVVDANQTSISLAITYTLSGAVTVTLPEISTIPGNHMRVFICDAAGRASINNISIEAHASDTILDQPFGLLQADFNSLSIFSDGGTQWLVGVPF